jgi:hypothetical protein
MYRKYFEHFLCPVAFRKVVQTAVTPDVPVQALPLCSMER